MRLTLPTLLTALTLSASAAAQCSTPPGKIHCPLPCNGAELFHRPVKPCCPGGQGAELFHHRCPKPCLGGQGAELFHRPCHVALPCGNGAQLFHRPYPTVCIGGSRVEYFHQSSSREIPLSPVGDKAPSSFEIAPVVSPTTPPACPDGP